MPAAVQQTPFPPAPPTIAGENITVSMFLNSPPYVQRAIENMTYKRFIADVIFGQGPPADGGAVVHDQVTANDLFTGRDVEEISPGGDFPELDVTEPTPLVALAKKYGGEVFVTYEDRRRNKKDVLGRKTTKLRNTIIKKVDTVAIAKLEAAPIQTMAASGNWGTAATDIVADLVTAKFMVDGLDMGYEADTVLVSAAEMAKLLKDKDIRDTLPREGDATIIRTGYLGRLMGLDFIWSNRVAAGVAYVLQRKAAGGISDEVPTYAKVIDSERNERLYIHGARVVTPYVTDPLCVVKVTGA